MTKTHGKLIIAGEHFVVAGIPALAVPAPLSCQVELKLTDSGLIEIDSVLGCCVLDWDPSMPVTEGELTTGHWLRALLYRSLNELGVIVHGVRLRIQSDIPVGGGMGSSAAIAVALVKEVQRLADTLWQKSWTDGSAYSVVEYSEGIQHGHSSGLDAWLCWHGRSVIMRPNAPNNQRFQPLHGKVPAFSVVYTGKPSSTTRDCVLHVKDKLADQSSPFETCMKRLLHSIEHQDLQVFYECIRHTHAQLNRLGVVPTPVSVFIDQIERAGGCAKISGAGSISGESAGTVLVWGVSSEWLNDLIQTHQYVLI